MKIRFCAESAGLIHMFTHWRHQLDRQVTDYLWRNDVFSEARIVRRLAWTDSQRRIFSNKIANRMLRCGKIVRLSSAMREEWKVPFYESVSRRHRPYSFPSALTRTDEIIIHSKLSALPGDITGSCPIFSTLKPTLPSNIDRE